ncbi:hypothetical protein FPY71_07255 [Aureimonas fodinaquatilis]|uniref:DUF1833 domain-containing protein n=1 Tax=Aureimonas fodinaquatilis TaxID=2565783 RepID=A0A5B0DU76_9HYPH|nr:hypothetical protein [Aureimonas fodinaquatilis]KAA0970314.1 hypothetical protein FPY71_07255 [Aureimonas fodinaquatilis]
MRTLSLTMRQTLAGQDSGRVAVVLLTISHPMMSVPFRFSSDPTQLLSETPLQYGTISRGSPFLFFPFSISLPDDVGERAPVSQIQIENVSRTMVELIRSAPSRATVGIELVLASSPSSVEVAFPPFDLNGATYNADTITMELSMDSLSSEPFPAGRFNPAGFPGLFA